MLEDMQPCTKPTWDEVCEPYYGDDTCWGLADTSHLDTWDTYDPNTYSGE